MSWFKIWYENEEIIGQNFEDWKNAPSEGIVMIYQFFYRDEHNIPYGKIAAGDDYYWMTPDEELGQSLSSSEIKGEWLDCDFPENASVKKGKWVSDERMDEVFKQSLELIKTGAPI